MHSKPTISSKEIKFKYEITASVAAKITFSEKDDCSALIGKLQRVIMPVTRRGTYEVKTKARYLEIGGQVEISYFLATYQKKDLSEGKLQLWDFIAPEVDSF